MELGPEPSPTTSDTASRMASAASTSQRSGSGAPPDRRIFGPALPAIQPAAQASEAVSEGCETSKGYDDPRTTRSSVDDHGRYVDRGEMIELAASINHRLRTPMTAVLGHSELLRECADSLPADQRRSLETLDDAVQRLNDAVVDVCKSLRDSGRRADG